MKVIVETKVAYFVLRHSVEGYLQYKVLTFNF